MILFVFNGSSMIIMNVKNKLRKGMLALRDSLPEDLMALKSESACNRLMAENEYKKSRSVFCFLSFGSEIRTDRIISDALLHKELYVPYIDSVSQTMHPVRLTGTTPLQKNRFGISEPAFDPQAKTPERFDLVIVPGLTFDRRGYRIGYGKGYYDQFFSGSPNSLRMGLAFDCQLTDTIPAEEHDQPVDIIVTEKEVIRLSTPRLPNNETP